MSETTSIKFVRQVVEQSSHRLTRAAFDEIQRFFFEHYKDGDRTPIELTREYEREEFLQVVDEKGQASGFDVGLLSTFRMIQNSHSQFGRWFREDVSREGDQQGQPVLLVARWLCHIAGLRHSTVEIFIDPPEMEGFTLLQVRGMDKIDAPGTLDTPCAGHISGGDPVEVALWKELSEELNLSQADLQELRVIGRYNSPSRISDEGTYVNVEHRFIYRARLVPSAVARIRFSDGEVAGLGVFTVSELRELVRRFPERVASGLIDSIAFYQ